MKTIKVKTFDIYGSTESTLIDEFLAKIPKEDFIDFKIEQQTQNYTTNKVIIIYQSEDKEE